MVVVDASVLANVVGDDESAGMLARRRPQVARTYPIAEVPLWLGVGPCPWLAVWVQITDADGEVVQMTDVIRLVPE